MSNDPSKSCCDHGLCAAISIEASSYSIVVTLPPLPFTLFPAPIAVYPSPMQVSRTEAPGKNFRQDSFAAVSIIGFMLSPAIRCIVNPPNTIVGAPPPWRGGHKDAGIPVDLLNVETCQGFEPSSYRE